MGLFNKLVKSVKSTARGFVRSIDKAMDSVADAIRSAARATVRSAFDLYVKKLREFLSPALWYTYKAVVLKNRRVPRVWDSYRKLNLVQFAAKIRAMPYRGDPLGGALDFTIAEPDYFFWDGLQKGRDCDDFSNVWYQWAKGKGYSAHQIIMMNGANITTSHVVCVWYDGSSWHLGNNQNHTSGYKTMEKAIEGVKNYTWTGGHHYEDLYWVEY